ncbi:MAG: hypothetical protein KIS78_33135 [Labilithrix sp.]|nr:hypothetical protein [Labilithrix sp.]MCW5837287.1 hypothetical protein [Labilithrix sp.]
MNDHPLDLYTPVTRLDAPSPRVELKGLAALVTDAVVHGASAIERVHLAVSSRPFDVLERIPVTAAPAGVVRMVHDLSTRLGYASVRAITRGVGRAVDAALDVV